jgi:predicted permease
MWSRLRNKLRYLLRSGPIDRDLAEELEIHRDMLREDEERRGASRDAAALAARRRMGNTPIMVEYSRDAWVVAWLDTLVRDVRYGLRSFVRSPGFTVTALATLALGIGANTAIFTVLNSVILRPLPYVDPGRLVMVWGLNERQGAVRPSGLIEGDVFDIRRDARSFAQLEAFQANLVPITMRVGANALPAQAVSLTPGTFALLGRQPILGRSLQDGDRFAIVLSYGYWQRQFGGDRTVVGTQVTVGTTPATIVGVMPRDFAFPYRSMLLASVSFTRDADVDLWVPLTLQPRRANDSLRIIGAVARLQPGVTVEQARTDVAAIGKRLAADYPTTNAGWGVTVTPPHDHVVAGVRSVLLLLAAGVGLVLLMACVNVANLLLARSVRRQREMAIRSAIGAARGRLLRQTLTESALLTSIGAALSWLVVQWLTRSFVRLAPREIPRLAEIAPDWRVGVYTLVLALIAAIVAGWLPALASSRVDLQSRLVDTSRGTASRRGARMRSMLVVAEVTLAVVLAFGTGLLVRSFIAVLNVDPGFETNHVLSVQVSTPRAYDTPDKRREFYRRLFARLEAVPGVAAVGGTTRLPLGGANSNTRLVIEGRDTANGTFDVGLRRAMHDYFAAMQIPIVRGRGFTAADGPDAPRVVLVNQALAARVFPGEDPIGRRMTLGDNAGIGTATIVGIVGDVRHGGLESAPEPEVYIHYLQNPPSAPLIVMRTNSDPAAVAAAVRDAVKEIDVSVPLFDMKTMAELRSASMTERRFVTWIALIFGAVALVLAMVGVYGVMAVAVGERTQEMGIRIALGADPVKLLALVVRQGLGLAALGIAAGVAISMAVAPLLATQLYGVTPRDPITFAGVPLVLLAAAAAACAVPALRAARVDPIAALRS